MQIKSVGPVDRKAINEAMGFLEKRLAVGGLLAFGEKKSMVAMLIDSIPRGS